MKTVQLQLPDETVQRLESAAKNLNVSTEQLVAATLENRLSELEAEFQKAADQVLEKNAELYRRLA